jgi:hypothetical protein
MIAILRSWIAPPLGGIDWLYQHAARSLILPPGQHPEAYDRRMLLG